MIYITSDPHCFHDREFIYKPRGFNSCEEMTQHFVQECCQKLTEEDDLYIVGDFCLGNDFIEIKKLINKIPCDIHLIRGNHDTDKKLDIYRSCGIEVVDAKFLPYKNHTFFLCHFPTETSNLESDPKHCIINLYGHVHKKDKFYNDKPYMMDISLDANDNHIVSLDELIARFENKVAECKAYLK